MKKKLLIITCLFFATISYSQVQLVKDFEPENNNGLFGSNHDFISLNAEIFVPGRGNGATGQELWKSNGTPEGTVILKDINPGIQSSIGSFSSITQDIGSSNLTGNKWNNSIVFNNELYFVAQDGVHGYELWKTDGSTEGTTMVIDITPGIESSEVKNLIVYNNKLYFFAEVYNGSESLYEIDGSNGGVKVIKTLVSGANNHNNFVTIFKNKMFFSSDGYLWESDGTTNGTVTITRGSPSVQLAPQNILVAGDNMYFTGNSGTTLRRELWKSDGTEAGTTVVKIINPNGGFSSVDRFVSFNNEVYFNTNDGVNGFELWKTNGTRLLKTMLYIGNYKFLEKALVTLVLVMSVSFLITRYYFI
jgi:ELWxxDGT repeat protein